MAKPSINRITPFDARYDKIVSMTYFGDMAYSNRIIIYNAETMDQVFDDTVVTFSLTHTIPANTLTNGVKYAIQGQTFDSEGIESVMSDKVYFWCFETPSFYFKDLQSGDTIESASYNATVVYEQADWEDISMFQFHIYDGSQLLLTESEISYDTDNISYSFRGLENGYTYYIRCTGITVNGMELDTGYIRILVKYENPNTYARMYARCDEETGVVYYETNIIIIESSTEGDFEYNNGFIDLIGKELVYDKDFIIPGDFTLGIRARYLFREGNILTCKNDKYGFVLSAHIDDEERLRFRLKVPNGLTNYILYTEPYSFTNDDLVTLYIRRINNIYSITCFFDYGYIDQTDMWFGSDTPTIKNMTRYDVWINTENTPTTKVDKDNVKILLQDNEPEGEQFTIWLGK